MTVALDAAVMGLPALHRHRVALECECGMPVEAGDELELVDELHDHIAAAHEDGLRREPAALLAEAYDA